MRGRGHGGGQRSLGLLEEHTGARPKSLRQRVPGDADGENLVGYSVGAEHRLRCA